MGQTNDLLIIGSGGMGRDTAWITERINKVEPKWNILGFVDDNEAVHGKVLNGHKVLGGTEIIADFPQAYVVCAVACTRVRKIIIDKVKKINPDVKFATLIDPSVIMSDYVSVGEGSIMLAGNIVSVDVTLGRHTILNAGCTVGHDAVIGDFATLYPGATVSGTTNIGSGAELGTGMQVIQGKKIGENTIIGAGAVVVKDLPDNVTAVGVPAKIIKQS